MYYFIKSSEKIYIYMYMYIQIRLILKRYEIHNFLHMQNIEYMHSILNINII